MLKEINCQNGGCNQLKSWNLKMHFVCKENTCFLNNRRDVSLIRQIFEFFDQIVCT